MFIRLDKKKSEMTLNPFSLKFKQTFHFIYPSESVLQFPFESLNSGAI